MRRMWALSIELMVTQIINYHLIYAQQGGQYILNLVDFYGASFIVFMLAIVELVAVSWIYGIDINSGFIAPLIVN